MKPTTLCLLVRDGKILLAMKKRGFGVGKWNGVGGKVSGRETIAEAALRETKEEIGIKSSPADLSDVGSIKFYFPENPNFNQHMHIFLVKNWQGEPKETEEMRPQWFNFADIPYQTMWVDDRYWLPSVLAGKKIEASFYFKEDGKSFDRYEIKEI